jgi:rare lipoprotein A
VNTRHSARASFRLVLLTACLGLTGTAYAATNGDAEGGVTMARAGQADRVPYGRTLRLDGRVAAAPGGDVRLEHAPRGEGWQPVAQTQSASDGSYSFDVRAERSGAFRAVSASGASEPRRVTVAARIAGRSSRHVRLGEKVRVRGAVKPARGGRLVRLKQRVDGRWRTVDRARTGSGGRFTSTWRAQEAGAYRVKATFAGDRDNGKASRRLRGRVRVYRPAQASWYGPGFYGRRTACGHTITGSIQGVANKYLPCGTKVTFRYRGRTATVPVIDRGPYAGGREWDLTPATKEKLGFGSTGVVWTTR